MKRLTNIGIALISILSIVGCSQINNEDTQQSINESTIDYEQNKEDYAGYSGVWTSNGDSSYDIYTQKGGGILNINIENNHVVGSYVYVQSDSYRIATIENIEADINNSSAEYNFSDDGWGNTGTIKITFMNEIIIEIEELVIGSDNGIGMAVTGTILKRESSPSSINTDNVETDNIEQQILNTEVYRSQSDYWDYVVAWDEDNLRTDTDRIFEPLLVSDQKEYTQEELQNYPKEILYLALNEIYARHGYIFENQELHNYFMGQVWYKPEIVANEFSDEVFNDYEKENLKLLLRMLNR